MTEDARFEDGQARPLNLGAEDGEDLKVISALVQDAVLPVTEMQWRAKERRFAMLLNRFRWEEDARQTERVQSLLAFDGVLAVASQGIDRTDKDIVLSVLSVAFEETEDAAGYIHITLAGDGSIRLSVEALDATLKDVTRPYVAPSRSVPDHGT